MQDERTGDRIALARDIDVLLASTRYRRARLGVAIHDLQSGTILYERDAEFYFHGASTTKMLTIASALTALGPDFRFHTRVRYTGYIDSGVLNGDLILVASGDPNLSARVRDDDTLAFSNVDHSNSGVEGAVVVPGDPLRVLRTLATAVAATGLRRVAGRVRIDVSLFPEIAGELGEDDVVSPIVINDNLIDVTASAGDRPGERVEVTLSPSSAYATFVTRAFVGAPDSQPTLALSGERSSPAGVPIVEITGTLAPGMTRLYSHRVASPSRFARIAFTEVLRQAGVIVDFESDGDDPGRDSHVQQSRDVLAEYVSTPFREAAKIINKLSQNLHAELCPPIVGAVHAATPGAGAELAGFAAERAFLEAASLDREGALQGDASGALGFFTPNFMCRFLRYVSTLPIYEAFRKSLPIMGVDGTLHNIATASSAVNHVFAKTGTMDYDDKLSGGMLLVSKSLAGYIDTRTGNRVAFAAFANNVGLAPGEKVVDVGQFLGSIAATIYEQL